MMGNTRVVIGAGGQVEALLLGSDALRLTAVKVGHGLVPAKCAVPDCHQRSVSRCTAQHPVLQQKCSRVKARIGPRKTCQ
jgi:hypothetical protein